MSNLVNEFIKELLQAVNYPCRFEKYTESEWGLKRVCVDMLASEEHADEFCDDWKRLTDIADKYGWGYDDERGKLMFAIDVAKENENGEFIPLETVHDGLVAAWKEIEGKSECTAPVEVNSVQNQADAKKKSPTMMESATNVLSNPEDRKDILGISLITGLLTFAGAVVMDYKKEAGKEENRGKKRLTLMKESVVRTGKNPKVWLVTTGMMLLAGAGTVGKKVYDRRRG